MRKFLLVLALLLCQMSLVTAQIPKKTMVEHFTNTKCSICANRNPGLNTNFDLHPQVLHISIHPNLPYPSCFLSQQNTADNNARTNYYGVYGSTPRIVINGSPISSTTNYADTSLFANFAGMSTMSIEIRQSAVGVDSIMSRIVVKRVLAGPPMSSAVLYAGLVEDTVFGNGGNGELQHYNVLRRSLFTSVGTAVNLPGTVGDSLVMTKTEAYGGAWDPNRMATVAILQESGTKALIQSELSSTDKSGVITGIDLAATDACKFAIFPNPATAFITVSGPVDPSLRYQLLNGLGAVVGQGTMTSKTIDVARLPAGIYFVVLRYGQAMETKRFLKRSY